MSSGFIPGDDLPENFTVRECKSFNSTLFLKMGNTYISVLFLFFFVFIVLSTVLENTAFLSEIVLRFPDFCSRLLNQKNEWLVLTKWAINFSNATGIYDKPESLLMNLVGFYKLLIFFSINSEKFYFIGISRASFRRAKRKLH